MNSNYDITTIEENIRAVVRGLSVSSHVYCNRPQAVADSVSDFIVVRVGGSVTDLATYGRCNVYVSLFAKDVNNLKNGKKLSIMYEKLVNGFPTSSGDLLITSHPTVVGDTGDDFGFHARIVQFNNVIIKAV